MMIDSTVPRDADTPVIFLMGPTAAGKTGLALDLADWLPSELVSVDSALVYRGLDIGTAKPNPALRQRVRHHLIDICAPTETYSAARFRADALLAIDGIRARGRVPILVGGTGLYFRALEQGIAALPAADPAVRTELHATLARDGAAVLHARLAAVDAAAAGRIHPHDPQRLVRALEVHALTGKTMTELWASGSLPALPLPIIKIALAPADRNELHRRIAGRFLAMLERGFLNEVRALKRIAGLTPAHPALRTVGYREAWRHVDGELSRAAMVERATIATRQLAKRQLTWLRREARCTWFDSARPDCAARVREWLRALEIFQAREYGLE